MQTVNEVNKIKYIVMLLAVALVLAFSGCDKTVDEDTITVLDPYEEREGVYNATGDVYNKTLNQLMLEHPETSLERKTYKSDDYYGNINSYATMEKGLTDVFVLPAGGIKDWVRKGAICSEAEYIYPLSNKYMTIIVYDKEKLSSLGYDTFPDNWDDVLKIKDEGIALCDMNGGSIRNTYLTPYTYMNCGNNWVDSLEDSSFDAPFVDESFLEALDMTKKLFDLSLTEQDFKISDSALNRFIDGDVAIAVITIDEMYKLKETLLKEDPKRYEQIGFSFIPANIDKTHNSETSKKYMTTTGISTVLVINSKLKDNPEKLKKCAEFCEYMTGKTFADNMAEMFGFECENKSDKVYNGDDVIWSDLLQLINDKNRHNELIECKNLGLTLEQSMLKFSDELLFEWIEKDNYTVEEVANYFQDYYEDK